MPPHCRPAGAPSTFLHPTEHEGSLQVGFRVTLYRFLNTCSGIIFVVTKAVYGYRGDNAGVTTAELVCGIFALIINVLGQCKSVARPTLWRLLHKDRAQSVQTIISRVRHWGALDRLGPGENHELAELSSPDSRTREREVPALGQVGLRRRIPRVNHPINVLCFDGGGVRGLSSLLILKFLMQGLQMSANSSTEPLPCDVFDMICGTWTGGIIALMLGRLRMNVDDAIVCFRDFSKTVFEESRAAGTKKTHTSIYDASNLEKWIKGIVAKYAIDEDASLRDPFDGTHRICRTFVVATAKAYANSPPKLFRTYSWEGRLADPCKVWEAARATTAAAAPFFDSVTFGSPPETYIDGSFSGSNNPSHLAIDEIGRVFPSRQIGCLLSLGTGVPDDVFATGDSLDNVAEPCTTLIRSCEDIHDCVWRNFPKWKKSDARGVYFRFSVDRGLGNVGLDEWNREGELTSITGGYLRHGEAEEKAESCVGALMVRAIENVNEEWEVVERM